MGFEPGLYLGGEAAVRLFFLMTQLIRRTIRANRARGCWPDQIMKLKSAGKSG